jgi:hypothetical protein
MKRICPSCNKKELYYKPFFSHPYMLCHSCDLVFAHSKIMELLFFLWGVIIYLTLILLDFYFGISVLYTAAPTFIITFFIIYFIKQYFPIKPVDKSEINLVPPTLFNFEKTDNVNENIRRYKEAQSKAIYNKLKE